MNPRDTAKAVVGVLASLTLFAAILLDGFGEGFMLSYGMVLVLLAVMSAMLGVDILDYLSHDDRVPADGRSPDREEPPPDEANYQRDHRGR